MLVARPGLAEPADTRGHEWLAERVTEVLGQGRGMRYLGIGLVYAWRTRSGCYAPKTCKYHPSCSQYALDALRATGS